jgi:hypothetical protein
MSLKDSFHGICMSITLLSALPLTIPFTEDCDHVNKMCVMLHTTAERKVQNDKTLHFGLISCCTLSIVCGSRKQRATQQFGNWICFCPLVKRWVDACFSGSERKGFSQPQCMYNSLSSSFNSNTVCHKFLKGSDQPMWGFTACRN